VNSPEIVVYPINRLSLRWAADFYQLVQEVDFYRKGVLEVLLPAMDEVEPGVARHLYSGGRLDEASLLEKLEALRRASKERDPDPKVLRVVELAGPLWSSIGIGEEFALAVSPAPKFGVLGGDGIIDAGYALPKPLPSIVLDLDRATELSRVGQGYPVVDVGSLNKGLINGLFMSVGAIDQALGMALLPLGYTPAESARVAAGVVLAMLHKGLWAGGRWVAGSALRFALPAKFEYMGVDATASGEFASLVCPRHVEYRDKAGTVLSVGFAPGERTIAGVLSLDETTSPVRGTLDVQQGIYVISTGHGVGGTLELSPSRALLSLPDGSYQLQMTNTGRVCPGPGMPRAGIMAPAVIRWLQDGATLLLGESRPENQKRVLTAVRERMSELPIGFVGQLPDTSDGIPRYLQAESSSGPSYYGSPARERMLASARLSKRIDFSGIDTRGKPALTFLQMARRAARGDARFEANIKAIEALRGERYSLQALMAADEKEAESLEDHLWKEGTKAAAPRVVNSIPLAGQESPVLLLVLTLWGVGERQAPGTTLREYEPIWQSPPLDAIQVNQIVTAARQVHGDEVEDPSTGEMVPFSPMLALRSWAAERSGLLRTVTVEYGEEGQPPAPFALVGAAVVDVPRMMEVSGSFPKPIPVGSMHFLGRQVQAGMYLFEVRLPRTPKRPLAPDARQLVLVHAPPGEVAPGIVPARQAQGDMWALAQGVTWVGWDRSHRMVLPLLHTTWQPTNLFGFGVIGETQAFKQAKKRLEEKQADEKEDKGKVLSADEIVRRAYYRVVTSGVLPFFGKPGGMDAIVGGRRAFSAVGGEAGLAVRRGATAWSPGRVQSPDPGHRHFATQGRGFFRNIFGFAANLCKETGACTASGVRRTRIGTADVWREALESVRGAPPRHAGRRMVQGDPKQVVFDMLSAYGIEVPDPADKAAVREALVALRDQLQAEYRYEVPRGLLSDQLSQEGDEFAGTYIDELSRLNPLRESDVQKAVAYGKSRKRKKGGDDKEWAGLPEVLAGQRDSASWELTPDKVNAVFPRIAEGRGTWSPEVRLSRLSDVDLVTRLSALPDALVKAGREKVVDPEVRRRALDPERHEMPFGEVDVMRLVAGQAGLSLEDALAVLQAQRGAQRISQTVRGLKHMAIQPSSALCKVSRKVKLKFYAPPRQAFEVGDTRNHRVLVWMSPPHLREARVMTFRRGDHIDCDMVGPAEMMPELLGKALQSTMYWLVERGGKPTSRRSRQPHTDVYVGRVGQPFLYLAYGAGEPVSIDGFTRNLQRAQAGEVPYRVALYSGGMQVALQRDTEAYEAAVTQQFGRGRLEVLTGEYTPVVQQMTQTLLPAPLPVEEEEEEQESVPAEWR